jgi:hypothetical protein
MKATKTSHDTNTIRAIHHAACKYKTSTISVKDSRVRKKSYITGPLLRSHFKANPIPNHKNGNMGYHHDRPC